MLHQQTVANASSAQLGSHVSTQPDDMQNVAKREKVVSCLTGSEDDQPDLVISAHESRCIARPTTKGLASVAFLVG
jgi:hypothetical protein